MPNEPPSLYQRLSRADLPVEEEAKRLARRVLQDWTHSASTDNQALVDGLQRAFLDEANHALRQVLFQLSARIELAMVRHARDGGGLDERTAAPLVDALRRATSIVDVYLDRSKAAQYVITLRPELFRLDEDLMGLLRWNGLLEEGSEVEPDLAAVEVVADRERLRDVLGHLVARFWFSRTNGQRLIVRVRQDAEGVVEGFIGLSRCPLRAEDLIEEINHPLAIEAVEIDIPYTRAVLERHGGTLYVATDDQDTIGFGFRLPQRPVEEGGRVSHRRKYD